MNKARFKRKLMVCTLLAFLAGIFTTEAQTIRSTTVDVLKQRIRQSPDTSFVVNFWATWCGPCLAELPHFEQLNKETASQKVKVILVSIDFRSQVEKKLRPFLRDNHLRSEVLWLDEPEQEVMINKVDSSWSGALPATLMIAGTKRKFFEREFDYTSLLQSFKNLQK